MTSRRITIVASELLGRPGTGGAGTADSLLAVALGRHGHQVELLVASGREIGELSPEWTRTYESAGVAVRVLNGLPGVRPSHLAPMLEVFHALRDRPPDLVVVNDWRGLGYAAMRARQLGLALTETAFVVHCHGPGRVLAEFAQKVPDTLARFAEEVTERVSLELADAVVSPSAWLLDWMRAHDWPVPESASVIQYVRQSAALDEQPALAPTGAKVSRLAFFGQLREGKGIRIFLASLDALEPELLDGVELVFLGSQTARWTGERIITSLPPGVKERLAAVHVETSLDREAALEQLSRAGTLAVMPSPLDNSPNTVSECIERGIPFVATQTGGIPELVAAGDRARVLCLPTSEDLAKALTQALSSRHGFAPASSAREPRESLEAWFELADTVAPSPPRGTRAATRVAVVASGDEGASHARRLAERTRSVEVEVAAAESRRAGFERTSADWIVFLDDDDAPDDGIIDTLVAAQAASAADVVTAAVRPADDPEGVQLFLGDPGALGLVENQYGVLGLVRASLAAGHTFPPGAVDPDWPFFARLRLAGARIVSIPEPLSTHAGRPGRVGDVPGEGLAVLTAFEEENAAELRDLPQLAATLAASYDRLQPSPAADPVAPLGSVVERATGVLHAEGVGGLARRAGARIRKLLRA
jgi:glycosyltransferase involved in cell wall biosynthesis